MSRWHSYLRSAEDIIYKYDGQIPLAPWIKDYFRLHKQMGSTDRKIISSLVYQYYRGCKAFAQLSFSEHLFASRFLCESRPDPFLAALSPNLNAAIELPFAEKEEMIRKMYPAAEDYFSFADALSVRIDPRSFSLSFLKQPELFLRIRPGKRDLVQTKLSSAGIPYQPVSDECISVANQSQIDSVLTINKEVVVQDYNSQRVGEFFGLPLPGKPAIWDCCAASGGKSIMVYDRQPSLNLTVSDIRESILVNLRKRFSEAGINDYNSFQADLTHPINLPGRIYDLVIADLPCSGSGTWSRTPEQLCFFKPARIKDYSDLQKEILSRITGTVKPGGRLVYITCSVFQMENEQVAEFVSERLGLQLITSEMLKGYDMRADSLFVAVFEKPAI